MGRAEWISAHRRCPSAGERVSEDIGACGERDATWESLSSPAASRLSPISLLFPYFSSRFPALSIRTDPPPLCLPFFYPRVIIPHTAAGKSSSGYPWVVLIPGCRLPGQPGKGGKNPPPSLTRRFTGGSHGFIACHPAVHSWC